MTDAGWVPNRINDSVKNCAACSTKIVRTYDYQKLLLINSFIRMLESLFIVFLKKITRYTNTHLTLFEGKRAGWYLQTAHAFGGPLLIRI